MEFTPGILRAFVCPGPMSGSSVCLAMSKPPGKPGGFALGLGIDMKSWTGIA